MDPWENLPFSKAGLLDKLFFLMSVIATVEVSGSQAGNPLHTIF